MHSDLVEVGWTEDHLNRIYTAITEEAQKARVGAQVLSVVGPLDPTTVAIPSYALSSTNNPLPSIAAARKRMTVDSDPTLHLTKISVNVYLRTREAADPELNAALTMFRRAANYIARLEDALVFNGRSGPDLPPDFGVDAIPEVYRITGGGRVDGLVASPEYPGSRSFVPVSGSEGKSVGNQVVSAIIESINKLDAAGQLGPYACVLSPELFQAICTPNDALVLPRDRILPFLQGPLLRSSAIRSSYGVVLATSANPLELVVARDIQFKFLQTTEQPRLAFQVSERIALRVKESAAIAVLTGSENGKS
jgi:uncharacterized linocin/CFP29 family protein